MCYIKYQLLLVSPPFSWCIFLFSIFHYPFHVSQSSCLSVIRSHYIKHNKKIKEMNITAMDSFNFLFTCLWEDLQGLKKKKIRRKERGGMEVRLSFVLKFPFFPFFFSLLTSLLDNVLPALERKYKYWILVSVKEERKERSISID